MSIMGDGARDDEVQCMCELLKKKIKKYNKQPEALKALKELGAELLVDTPHDRRSERFGKYLALFRK